MGELTGVQKATAVLMSIDPGEAAKVIRCLSDEEITVIGRALSKKPRLEPQEGARILAEFCSHSSATTGIHDARGLRILLETAVGPERTPRLLQEIGLHEDGDNPFRALRELAPDETARALGSEHPQVVALVLAHLPPKQAADVLGLMDEEKQVDIVRRMAYGGETSSEVVKRIDTIISAQTAGGGLRPTKTPAERRYKAVADILNLLRRESEQVILERLNQESPEVASSIRDFMFTFEDLRFLSDADIRKVLMSIDSQMLALALKTASQPLKEKIFHNLSKRAAENVNEEQELLGLRPRSQVEAAQAQIAETVRGLDSSGELSSRGATAQEDPLV